MIAIRNERKTGEKGMIAVETLIAFIGFLMLTVVLILFVNLAAVQTRVHHGLTQTAKEVSVYCYLFDVVGATGAKSSTYKQSESTKKDIKGFYNNVTNVFDAVSDSRAAINSRNLTDVKNAFEKGVNGATGSYNQIKKWAENPKDFFSGLMMILMDKGLDTGFDALFGFWIAPAIFDRYMEISGVNSDAQSYFRSMGVFMDEYNPSDPKKGLSFVKWGEFDWRNLDNLGLQGTQFLHNGNELVIKVEYYYDLGAFIYILPEKFTKLKIVQQVKIKAWVGDGQHYR